MLCPQQVLRLAHDGLDDGLVADGLVDRSGELVEQIQPAVAQPLDVVAAVERGAEQPDDGEQRQALAALRVITRAVIRPRSVLIRRGDQAADGAEAEAGADPPAAQGDDDERRAT